MGAPSYFDSAYPEPWQVLGVRLRPFSLGHFIKLRRLGCAYTSDEPKQASVGDLVLGVICCSMPTSKNPERDEFWSWINRREPSGWLTRLLYRIDVWRLRRKGKTPLAPAELDVMRMGRKIGMRGIEGKAQLFADYIKEHSRSPLYWINESRGDKTENGAHWSHTVEHVLTSKCGYTHEEALNVPLGLALSDFFKYLESEGSVRLMTDAEVKAVEGSE